VYECAETNPSLAGTMETDKPTYIDLTNLKSELTSDQVYNVLSNARRRYTLYCLYQAEGELSLDELAERLAAYENDTTVEAITETERRNMYISLYQTHLPKLSEHGMVEYDETDRIARLTERTRGAEVRLDPDGRPWHLYYGSVAVVGATASLGLWFQLFLVELLTWTGIALFTLLGLLFITVSQYLVRKRAEGTLTSAREDYCIRLDELV
jgi:hypothetical protein